VKNWIAKMYLFVFGDSDSITSYSYKRNMVIISIGLFAVLGILVIVKIIENLVSN